MSLRARPGAPLLNGFGALVRLAGPITLSQLATSASALISTAVLGRLGTAALAAAAYSNALYGLCFAVLLGVLSAVSARTAQAHGRGDPAGVNRTLAGGLWLALGLSVPAVFVLLGLAALLPHLAPPGLRADLAAQFLALTALGLPATLATVVLRGSLEGSGRPQVVTAVTLLGVGTVALLSPALAFGWGPLPALGVLGVGVAGSVTAWSTALLLLTLVRRRLFRFPQDLRAEVRALWRLGWPIGVALGAEGGSASVLALLMARFGPEALGAHTVVLQMVSAAFTLPLGIAAAQGIRVAHAAGAGDRRQVRRAGLLGIGVAFGVMAVVALMELGAPRAVLRLFIGPDAAGNAGLIHRAVALLSIAAVFQVLDGVIIASNIALRNLHDTRWPLLISLTAYWLVGLGGGWLLAFAGHLGPAGLWWGLTLGALLAASALGLRFMRRTGDYPSAPDMPS